MYRVHIFTVYICMDFAGDVAGLTGHGGAPSRSANGG